MSESSGAGSGPSADELLRAAGQASDLEISAPAKVEILAINTDQALVRVIAADGDTESRVVQIDRAASRPPTRSKERTPSSQEASQ